MAKKIMVFLDNGDTVEGVMGWTWKDVLKVKSARIHARGQEAPVKAGGYLEISYGRIYWIQVLEAGE